MDNPSEKTVGSIEAFISMGLNKLGVNEEFIDFLSQTGLDLQKLAGKKNAKGELAVLELRDYRQSFRH